MKKRTLQHNGLHLNKKVVSNLASNSVKGGTGTLGTLLSVQIDCGALTGTCMTALGCPYTKTCPPTELCILTFTC